MRSSLFAVGFPTTTFGSCRCQNCVTSKRTLMRELRKNVVPLLRKTVLKHGRAASHWRTNRRRRRLCIRVLALRCHGAAKKKNWIEHGPFNSRKATGPRPEQQRAQRRRSVVFYRSPFPAVAVADSFWHIKFFIYCPLSLLDFNSDTNEPRPYWSELPT